MAEWLERSKMTQRAAAALIGLHFTHLNQILRGRRMPGRDNAVLIEQQTGIPVEAWTPTAVDSSARSGSRIVRKRLVGKA